MLENEFISWLQQTLPPVPKGLLGIGDDAAVLTEPQPGGRLVVTTDLLSDGVDFLLDEVEPEQVGHKALGVNLSDLAAMAARPMAAFVSLALPSKGNARHSALELAKGLYQGMLPLANKYNLAIAGGDTNTFDGPLTISITAIGQVINEPLLRSGGQVGDQLLVTGQLGGSILGRHLAVEPRVNEALCLDQHYQLHAGIDISDGLALDVSRLAEASGVGAVLDLSAIPVSDAARRLSQQDGRNAIEHALGDGEDFELVLAVPPAVVEELLGKQPLDVPLTRIGQLVAEPGLWQLDAAGRQLPLEPTGYQHGGDA